MSLKDNSHEALLYSSVAEAWEATQGQSLKPQQGRLHNTKMQVRLKEPRTNVHPHVQMPMVMALCQKASRRSESQLPTTLSDFIRMGNHSSLRSHIIRGYEMLTNEQTIKWQSDLRLLCTGAMTGKSLTSSHSQADAFRERGEQQSFISLPPLYAPWNCCSSQSMIP